MPTDLAGVAIDWKSLFEKMSFGFSVQKLYWDDQGNPVDIGYIDVNPAFERITGISREKAVGHRTSELVPNLEKIVLEHYGKVVRSGEPTEFEQYVNDLKIYFRVYAFKTSENEFGTIFEDITSAMIEKEARLKETALLNTLIDSMTDFVFYKDIEGRYVICNERFARDFAGKSKNTVSGLTDEQLFAESDPEKLKFILGRDQEVFEKGVQIKVIWNTKLADGRVVSLETVKTPFRDSKGNILGLVGVSRDVTEGKEVEKALNKRMSELEFLNRLMVDRELKMIELKKKIEKLSNALGQKE